MVRFLLSLIFFLSIEAHSQKSIATRIHGKVVADSATVEGINIVNLVNEKSTTTDSNGEFFILANVDDLLVFTAVNLEIKRKLIEVEDLDSKLLIIEMIPKNVALNEVVVNQYAYINAVNLGIISKDQKKYTAAERKLKTAGDFKPIHLLGLLGGALAIDPILNAINGRTKLLKKELEVERKELLLKKLDGLFETNYYTNNLDIPKEYIKGFLYYLLDNKNFVNYLNDNDKQNMMIIMGELALQFNSKNIYDKQ